MKEFITNSNGIIIDFLLVFGGISGFWSYYKGKRDDLRASIIVLIHQIDHIEEIVRNLRNSEIDNIVIYNMKEVITTNYWEQNKTKLIKILNYRELKIIDEFYMYATLLDTAKRDIESCVRNTWIQKSELQQNEIQKKALKDTNVLLENDIGYVFTPELAVKNILRSTENMTFLSGTTTFEKLLKKSKISSLESY